MAFHVVYTACYTVIQSFMHFIQFTAGLLPWFLCCYCFCHDAMELLLRLSCHHHCCQTASFLPHSFVVIVRPSCHCAALLLSICLVVVLPCWHQGAPLRPCYVGCRQVAVVPTASVVPLSCLLCCFACAAVPLWLCRASLWRPRHCYCTWLAFMLATLRLYELLQWVHYCTSAVLWGTLCRV